MTLALEGVIAVAFLAPLRGSWRQLRDLTLLMFVVLTYAIVPVAGFGLLLVVMSLAQSDLPERGRTTFLYLGVVTLVAMFAARDHLLGLLGVG